MFPFYGPRRFFRQIRCQPLPAPSAALHPQFICFVCRPPEAPAGTLQTVQLSGSSSSPYLTTCGDGRMWSCMLTPSDPPLCRPEGQTAHFFGTVADFAVAVSSALLEAAAVAAWVRQAYPQADICFTGTPRLGLQKARRRSTSEALPSRLRSRDGRG